MRRRFGESVASTNKVREVLVLRQAPGLREQHGDEEHVKKSERRLGFERLVTRPSGHDPGECSDPSDEKNRCEIPVERTVLLLRARAAV
jgi:hypothetical protein